MTNALKPIHNIKYKLVSPEELEALLSTTIPPDTKPPADEPSVIQTYDIVNASNYAKALEELRASSTTFHPKDSSGRFRPLTARETLEARLEQDDLLEKYNNTCTGIYYKQSDPNHFYLIPISPELLSLPSDFNSEFYPFNSVPQGATQLSRSGSRYNASMPYSEVIEHEGWLTLAEDRGLLERYAQKVFQKIFDDNWNSPTSKAMGFYLRNSVAANELRAVCLNDLNLNSGANGGISLDGSCRFVRVVAQRRRKNFGGGK